MKLVTPYRDTAVRGALAVLRFGAVAVGCILLLHAVAWTAMGYGLSMVRAVESVHNSIEARTLKGGGVFAPEWFCRAAEYSLGYCFIPKGKPRGRIDGMTLTVMLVTLVAMVFLIGLMAGAETAMPDRKCVYAHCWPHIWQGLALALPLIAAATVMIAMSCFADRIDVWVRRIVPAAIQFVGLVLLALLWDYWFLLFFAGPPPW